MGRDGGNLAQQHLHHDRGAYIGPADIEDPRDRDGSFASPGAGDRGFGAWPAFGPAPVFSAYWMSPARRLFPSNSFLGLTEQRRFARNAAEASQRLPFDVSPTLM